MRPLIRAGCPWLSASQVLLAVLAAAAAACAPDGRLPLALNGAGPALTSVARSPVCPASPDIVVFTEAQLRSAVATAPAGTTIAVSGTIDVSFGAVVIDRSDLRLTCAAPEAGLRGNALAWPGRLLRIHNARVSVTGLRLDGQNTGIETMLVQSTLGGPAAEDVTLADNDMTCGPNTCATFHGTPRAVIARNHMAPASAGTSNDVVVQGQVNNVPAEDVTLADNDMVCGVSTCAFFIGTPRALIARNRVTAAASVSGIHVQRLVGASGAIVPTDGTRVEHNYVTTSGPSTNPLFGGIRLRDGSGLVAADNVVTGPWMNAMSLTALAGGEVSRNELRGPIQEGIALGPNAGSVRISVDGLGIRNNRVTEAGIAGLGVRLTCRSVFVGNNLSGNANDQGAVFFPETGANTFVGNGTIVFDTGALDCDGDGIPDPNVISGATRLEPGLPGGALIGGAVSGAVSVMQ